MNIDFDALYRLSVNEPNVFNILRKKLIDRQVRKYSKDATDLWLKRGWWTKVELEMNNHNNPIGRMVVASKKMWDSHEKLNRELNKKD